MRNSTRLRFFLAAASVSTLAAVFIACGGSDDQDVTAPPDSGTGDTNRPDTNTAKPDTGVPDTGPPKEAGPDGPVYNPGDATVLEAGPEYDGSINCVAGGQIEVEDNGDPSSANDLRLAADAACYGFVNGVSQGNGCSRCGVIFDDDPDAGADAGDGGLGGTELEHVSFTLHPETTNFFLQYGGDVKLTVTVEGSAQEYVIANGLPAPTLPYVAGKVYTVRVTSTTGKLTPWRVTLYENKQ